MEAEEDCPHHRACPHDLLICGLAERGAPGRAGAPSAEPGRSAPAAPRAPLLTIGTPIEPRNVNRRWDELRRKAGLDWLRLHDLRHGCATFLLAKGVPDRVIMEVLGHAEIGVTMNTYAHVLPVLRQEAADAIDELFGA
jgi:integrase